MEEFSTSFDMDTLERFLGQAAEQLGGELRTEKLQKLLRKIPEAPVDSEHTVTFRTNAGDEIRIEYFIDDVDVIDLYVFGPAEVKDTLQQIYAVIEEAEEETTEDEVEFTEEEWHRWRERRAAAIADNKRAVKPIISELRALGVRSIYNKELTNLEGASVRDYPQAVPVLLGWLTRLDNLDIKLSVAIALNDKIVKKLEPNIPYIMLREYHRLPLERDIYRDNFSTKVSFHADDRLFDEIAVLLRDSSTVGRDGFVYAMPKMRKRRPDAIALLLELVQDDDEIVAITTAEMLGNMKVIEAIPLIQPFLSHKDSWYRTQAKGALSKLERAASRNAPHK